MREQRLLERIRAREIDPLRREGDDPVRIRDSVLLHLQRILNTRQGNVPIADDYGIPDFLDFLSATPESMQGMERTIRQVIQKYEPRLESIRVQFIRGDENILSLRFQIFARLSTESKTQVYFETVVDSGGKIRVKI